MRATEARQREAALLLHGMRAHDRDAVLARLDAPQRRVLEPLLDELATLGIPVVPDTARPAPTRAEPKPVERLMAADTEAVAAALRPCAAVTIASMLRGAPSPWRASVLEALPRSLQAEVAGRLEEAAEPLPMRVRDVLHERLLAELASERPSAFVVGTFGNRSREDAGPQARHAGEPRPIETAGRTGRWKRWLRWTS